MDLETRLVLFVIYVITTIAVGVYVAVQKGRSPSEGLTLGLFFGPIGWILVGLLPEKKRKS
jgi:hypothetical protein